MGDAPRFLTAPTPARLLKAVRPGVVQAVLTWPCPDIEGDVVDPAGCDFAPFEATGRVVDWTHTIPVGRGTVRKAVIDGHTVPVGTTTFFASDADVHGIDLSRRDHLGRFSGRKYTVAECRRAADDVRQLVEADEATGVSLEFTLKKGHFRKLADTGPAGRPPLHVSRCDVHRYAHAYTPVNPNARTLLPERFGKAIRLAETGRLPGGAPLSPHVLDTLRIFKAFPRSPLVVGGWVGGDDARRKAMDDEAALMDAPPTDEPLPADDAPDTTPTAQAAYTLAQGLSDLATAVSDLLTKGEHVKGRKAVKKLLAKLDGLAAEAAAAAEMVEADTADPDADEPDGDEGADTDVYDDAGDDEEREPADEPPAEPEPLKKAADGQLVTKSGFKPLRFRLSDLKPVPVPVQKATNEKAVGRRRDARRDLELRLQRVLVQTRQLQDAYANTPN